MAIDLVLSGIVAFFLLVLACIFKKGDIRAGFKTVAGEIFLEAKEQTKPVQTQRREDDQKTVKAELKQ